MTSDPVEFDPCPYCGGISGVQVLRELIALGGQTLVFTEEQWRFRLRALAVHAAPSSHGPPDPARPTIPAGRWLSHPPNQLPAASRFHPLNTPISQERAKPGMNTPEPLNTTGDPWIDGYLTFRQAWLDGAPETELTDLATECRRGLPTPTPPVPAALFIHRDILITSQRTVLPPQLVTALWVPDNVCAAQ